MYDFKKGRFLKFYLSTIFKSNYNQTKIVYDLNLKLKYCAYVVLVIEVIKNAILIITPMSLDMRYIVCDLLIVKEDNQRGLNFIVALVLTTFGIFIIFLTKVDMDKLSWIDFLYIDNLSFVSYSKRHNLTLESTKFLFICYNLFVFVARGTYIFYLIVVYMYYGESFLLSFKKKIGLFYFIFTFLPTLITTVIAMSWFYVTIAKMISVFILFNLFQYMKLDKLSKDLINYQSKDNFKFTVDHLFKINFFLHNFENSQLFFNYSNQSFLAALFCTLVFYVYAFLVSKNTSVYFLIISYTLNIVFVLFSLSCSSSIFKYKFQQHLRFVHLYIARVPMNWRLKYKLSNLFFLSTKHESFTYSYFEYFKMDLHFALSFWLESICLVLLAYNFTQIK